MRQLRLTGLPSLFLLITYPIIPLYTHEETSSISNILHQINDYYSPHPWNELIYGCSSQCTVSYDASINTCWRGTLNYFEQILVGAMRRYAIQQANRAIWESKHNQDTDYNVMTKESVKRMIRLPAPELEDLNPLASNKSLTRRLLKKLIPALVGDAKVLAESVTIFYQDYPAVPDCPLGCERHWDPFLYLFLASVLLTFILGSIIVILVFVLDRRERKFTEMEAKEYGVNAGVVIFDRNGGVEGEARVASTSDLDGSGRRTKGGKNKASSSVNSSSNKRKRSSGSIVRPVETTT